jgi:hypothetical protein
LADRYLVGHAVDEAGAEADAEAAATADDDAAAVARDDTADEAVGDATVDAAPDDDAFVGLAGGAAEDEDEDDAPAVQPATATPIKAAAAARRPADLVEPSIPTSFRGPGTAAKRDMKSRCLYDFSRRRPVGRGCGDYATSIGGMTQP